MSNLVRLPGAEEAEAISLDMQIAKQGVVAWVRAGLRLADVKARLPHGEFMKWVNSNCARVHNLSLNYICRAKTVAEALIEHIEKENERTYTLDELIFMLETEGGQLAQIVDGKSTRQLTLEARDPEQLTGERAQNEIAAKAWCEARWLIHLDDRDDWEPLVLSGERSYVDAKNGMIGAEATKGKSRNAVDYCERICRNFSGAARHFKKFDELNIEQQQQAIEEAAKMAEACPPRIAAVLRKMLPKDTEA